MGDRSNDRALKAAQMPGLAGACQPDMLVPAHFSRARSTLLRSTALQAVVVLAVSVSPQGVAQAQSVPAALSARAASLSATALPTGGKVVAGAATIVTSGSTLDVTQSTSSASVNWRSFDVGTAGTVSFTAPSAQSVTINQVVGPDPSVIAGKITANDQLVLINQSGVLFTKGSEVNANSLVVSAIGITEANLKAGKLALTKPARPGAAVINQGTISVKQTGLAALVAPEVANSGLIQAKLGHVVLAGAEAATIDLYGDGLLSIDVTRQVTTAPTGANGQAVTSLVTNSGTIQANGGTVLLTAAAVEGIVTNLVTAGGKITANTVNTPTGSKAGEIVVNATGGGALVTGTLSAQGKQKGTKGGQIQVNATDTVGVASTAKINASGRAGGGTVAIGTTLARAKGGPGTLAPVAKQALIAPGAVISANATAKGNGGQITVLSTDATYEGGKLSATGGKFGGNGGTIEISGNGGLWLTGSVDVSAPLGVAGLIVIDPVDLVIDSTLATSPSVTLDASNGGTLSFDTAPDPAGTLDPSQFNSLIGNVLLQATNNLTVNAAVTYVASGLTLEAGNNLVVNASVLPGVGGGNLTLIAASANPSVPVSSPAGSITIGAAVGANTSTGTLLMTAGTGGISLGANVSGSVVDLNTTGGGVTQTAGVITASTLQSSSGITGAASLNQANLVTTLGTISTTAGFALTNNQALTVGGPVTDTGAASTLALTTKTGGLTLAGNVSATNVLDLVSAGTISQSSGSISAASLTGSASTSASLNQITNLVGTLGAFTTTAGFALTSNEALTVNGAVADTGAASTLALTTTTGGLTLAGNVSATNVLDLVSAGTISQSGGSISAASLTGSASTSASLNQITNLVGTLGAFTTTAGFALTSNEALTVNGAVADTGAASTLALVTKTGGLTLAGNVSANNVLDLSSAGTISQTAGTISATTLQSSDGIGGNVRLTDAGNKIATLDAMEVTGSFALRSDESMAVDGAIAASGATITLGAAAAALSINTPFAVTTGGTLSLQADSISTATTSATSLNSNATGLVELASYTPAALTTGSGPASTSVLGSLNTGTLHLGAIAAGTPTATSISLGTLSLSPTGTLLLSTTGGIVETGALTVGTLSGTAGTTIALTQPTNSIGTIGAGGLVAATGIQIVDASPLSVAGSVSLTGTGAISIATDNFSCSGVGALSAAGGTVEIGPLAGATVTVGGPAAGGIVVGNLSNITAGTLRLGGSVLEPLKATTISFTGNATGTTATLDLESTGAVSQTAGTLSAGTLTGNTGALTLNLPGNRIAGLGALAVNGSIALRDAGTLAVTGNVQSAADSTIALIAPAVTIAAGGGLTVPDGIGGGLVTINADLVSNPGTIVNAGGTVAIAPITPGSTMQLGTGGLLLANIDAPTVQLGSLNGVLITTGSINIAAPSALNAGTTNLALYATGAVTQGSGDVLTVGTLTGQAGSVALTQSNTIATLGAFTTTAGGLAITDAGVLTVSGPVSVPSAQNLSLSAGTLNITGTAADTIAAPGGTITLAANTLTLPAAPVANLIDAGSGTVAIEPQTPGLAMGYGTPVTGLNVTAGGVTAGTLELGGTGGVAQAGSLTLGTTSFTGTLILDSQGAISQAGAVGITGPLIVNAGTDVNLATSAANAIPTLGNVTLAAGTFSLADSAVLTQSGTLSAGHIVLSDTAGGITVNNTEIATSGITLAAAGAITLAANISAGTIDLSTSAGGVSQTGGTLNAAMLQSASGVTGTVSLLDNNTVSGLGSFAVTTGNFTLTDAHALTQSGTLTAANITLSDTSSLTLGGNLNAGSLSLSTGAGGVSQTGGVITAGTLLSPGGIAGGATLDQANAISRLGAIAITGGGFTLAEAAAQALAVNGAVSVPSGQTIAITTDRFSFGLGGSLAAGTGVVALGPTTASTTVDVGGSTGSGIEPGNLSLITAGTIRLGQSNAGPSATSITFNGSVATGATLDLETSGAASQASGSISAPTLIGSVGSLSLNNASNLIATLGSFTATGGLTLNDGEALSVSGIVSGGPSAVINDNSFALAIPGSLSATNVSLTAGTIGETGTLTAGTLTGNGTTVSLTGTTATTNQIATLGSFTATGGLTLNDGQALSVSGIVSGGPSAVINDNSFALAIPGSLTATSVGLTAGSITIPGSVAGSTSVSLASAGTIGETGTLTTGTLTGNGTTVSLTGTTATTNQIATLGSFTATGGLTLNDGEALSVSGIVSGGPSAVINDNSFALSIPGSLTATTVSLTAGTIGETGTLTAGTLTGNGTAVSLTGTTATTNQIATLGSFTATSGLTLNDGQALSVSGIVSGGPSAVINDNSFALSIPGSLTATTVGLTAGSIDETGALNAGTLTGSGTAVSLTGTTPTTNQIATLGSFTATSGLTLNDGQALSVSGVVSGGPSAVINDNSFALAIPGSLTASTVALTAGNITIPGSVAGSTSVSLASAGTIGEAGTLTAGTLTGNGTTVSLTGTTPTTNQIASLGSFTATSDLTLNDGQALSVSGVVSAGPSAVINDNSFALAIPGSLTATSVGLTAGSITIPGSVAGSTSVSLASTGTIGETGTLTAGTLTGNGTTVSLTGTTPTTNQIATLGSFTATGGLTLNDGQALSVSGIVSGGPSAVINDNSFALSIPGNLTATTVSLTAGNISIPGSVAGSTSVSLASAGTIAETGTLTAGTLTGNGTTVSLTGTTATTNQIASLGSFTATSGLTLNDGEALSVSGIVSGGPSATINDNSFALSIPGSLTASTIGLTAGNITIPGSVAGSTSVSLASAGTIGETGTLTAGTLTGNGTTVSLTGTTPTTNQIATLGSFTATSGLTLNDGEALSVSGVVSAGPSAVINDNSFALAIPGSLTATSVGLTAGSITIPGSVAGSTSVSLASTGTIGETGTLTAGTLTGNGTTVSLTGTTATTNQIATLGSFTATGGLTLNDGEALSVSGIVSGGPSAVINDNSFALAIPGSLTATTVDLSAGSVTLGGSVNGSSLVSIEATGTIAVAGVLTAGTATLSDNSALASALSVSGTISAGTINLDSTAGGTALSGLLNATSTGVVDLSSAAGVLQTGGTIVAGTLQSSFGVTGNVTLNSATNQIGTLGTFNDGAGSFALTDQSALTVSGVLTAGTATLSDSNASASALSVTGSIDAGSIILASTAGGTALSGLLNATSSGIVDLSSAAGVSQAGGTIVAGTLQSSGGVTGNVSLTSATNQIATLGSFNDSTDSFALTDQSALTVSGVLTAGTATLSDSNASASALSVTGSIDAGSIILASTAGGTALSGLLNATSSGIVDLSSAAGVSQTGGTIIAGTLQSSGGVTGNVTLTSASNQIATIANFNDSTGSFALNDGQALSVSGSLSATTISLTASSITIPGSVAGSTSVSLASAGTIGETGTLTAGTLSGNGTTVSLTGASGTTNQIATLGSFTATSGLTLNDGEALSVSGVVSGGPSATINTGSYALSVPGSLTATTVGLTAGSITIPGSVAGSTSVSLVSAGTINETGTLVAGTLTGSGTTVSLTGASATANQIATLNGFGITGGFTLNDGEALAVTGEISNPMIANVVINTGSYALTITSLLDDGPISLTAGSITIPGGVVGTSVTLNATGTISETGMLFADTLTGSGTNVSLTGLTATTNRIATLGDFTATSGLTLNDGVALSVSGVVAAGPSATINDNSFALSIPGSLTATTVGLTAGSIDETGALNAGTLTGSGTAVSLTGTTPTTNQIATLGNFTATSGLTLNDGQALSVSGTVSGGPSAVINDNSFALAIPGSLTATTVALTAGNIIIPGSVAGSTSVSLASAGTIGETGTLTAGTLTGNGTTVSLTGTTPTTNQIASLGSFTATSGLTLNDGQALSISGIVSGGPSAVINDNSFALVIPGSLTATSVGLTAGNITIPGSVAGSTSVSLASTGTIGETGTLTADTLTGNGTTVSLTGTTATTNQIATLGSFTATGGLTLNDGQALSVSGIVSGGPSAVINDNSFALSIPGNLTATTVSLTAGNISIPGSVSGSTSVSLASAGTIGETGTLTAGTLTGNGTTVSLTGTTATTNQIASLGSFTATSGLTLNDGQALSISGIVSGGPSATINDNSFALAIPGSLSAATIGLTAGSITIPGSVAGSTSVSLASAGSINETGTLTAGTLTGNGTTVSLIGATPATNQIANLANFTATTSLSVNDGEALTLIGKLTAPTLSLSDAGGSITEGVGGVINTPTLTSANGIAGDLILASASNSIATLGGITTSGSLAVVDSAALAVNGPVSAANASLSDTSAITLAGNLTATSLDLTTTSGGVNQTGGVLTLGTLTSVNGIVGGASLTSAGNSIATLGATTVSAGNLVLTDAANLTVTGPLVAPNTTITSAGSIALPGAITTGTFDVMAGGTIVRPDGAGAFTVALLTGNAQTLANFGTAAAVTTLASFLVPGGTLALDNGQPLSITGPLTADYIAITATGQLNITGTVTTLGLPLATQNASVTPVPPGSYFAVRAPVDGGTAIINQTGTLLIQPPANDPTATVRFNLPSNGGSIDFANLVGPQADILLYTQNGGSVDGAVNIGSLTVIGTNGSASLTGFVANTSGPEAARLANIKPNPMTEYRFNSCPIGTVNCVLIPINSLPMSNPLRDYVLDTGQNNADDDDLALPDVSSKDY